MNKDLKNRLDKIPSNWNELSTGDYIKLISQLNIEDDDSDVKILSILTDVDEDILDDCSYSDMKEYINRLSFLTTDIPNVKINYKCKDVSEISNSGFNIWMKLSDDPINNLNKLLPVFFDELNEDEINDIPYPIINQCFFLLRKKYKRYLFNSVISLNWKLVKMILRKKVETLFKIFKIKTN